MKKKHKEFIPAMEVLLKFYQGDSFIAYDNFAPRNHAPARLLARNSCPLCNVARALMRKDLFPEDDGDSSEVETISMCDYCPWTVMMGKTCHVYVMDDFFEEYLTHADLYDFNVETVEELPCSDPEQLKQDYNGPWVEMRIEQLNEWIATYNEEVRDA